MHRLEEFVENELALYWHKFISHKLTGRPVSKSGESLVSVAVCIPVRKLGVWPKCLGRQRLTSRDLLEGLRLPQDLVAAPWLVFVSL